MDELGKICPPFDIIISCIGSKTGKITDAWRVEFEANKNLLQFGLSNSIEQFILLSAICVQRPKLEFQFAKLAFEKVLINSKINHTIIRPTAFFKSLAGQVENVRNGKKFIYFDNGEHTSCKPISENDLAKFICQSIAVKAYFNQVLPIGGKGPAITPLQMGTMIFDILGKKPTFRSIPSKLFTVADKFLSPLAIVSNRVKNTQQFLRIASYYARESMLFYNYKTSTYDASLTPEYGEETLESHYKNLLFSESIKDELGPHKLF